MYNPLLPETIEKKIQSQPETRPATLEDRANTLRGLIAKKAGSPEMLTGWRKDLAELQEQIDVLEAMKTNPGRTFGNVEFLTFEQMFDTDFRQYIERDDYLDLKQTQEGALS